MDEYIKREDALDAVLFALVGTCYQSKAIYAIRDVPTADVTPSAEVDRLRFNLQAVLEERAEDMAEVAREIFEEVQKTLIFGADRMRIAELKKKYTEEKK